MATQIFVPVLGESITEAILAAWLKQPGDEVRRGDELAELETAKATMPLECPVNGVLLQVVVEPGSVVVPGQLLAVVGKQGEVFPSAAADGEQAATSGHLQAEQFAGKEVESARSPQTPTRESAQARGKSERRRISPAARQMARQLGVDLAQVSPTVPGRRISSTDVQAAAGLVQAGSAASVDLPFERRPLNTIRRALAAQMSESARSIPQFSASCEADAGRLLASRRELQANGVQVSITVLLAQLTARALMEHPLLNARYNQDELILYKTVNLAVAVAGEHGLTAPVIRHAEQHSLAELAAALQELAAAARRGRLSLEQVSGATFTLSNLGMTGISQFVPLVNPPQSAILGVGAIRPALLPTPQGGIEPAHLLTLTVSADHRVLDGAEAAAFLNTLKLSIETPVFQR